ncbi:MAG: type II toxin-antitoxin system VapC family toxin [Armatimonadetes bacterium]|nr:type II toxin-antitoxin system VapC family toxin [Armatimonadota bacterium]
MERPTAVVDASVAVKWFLDEPGSLEARALLDGSRSLAVPDLIYAEVGNVLWKHVRRGTLTGEEAQAVLEGLGQAPWSVQSAASLVAAALEIAAQTGCTVYDGLYLALAIGRDGVLVTADRRLYERVETTELARYIEVVTAPLEG